MGLNAEAKGIPNSQFFSMLVLLIFDQIRNAVKEIAIRHSLDVELLEEFSCNLEQLPKKPEEEFDRSIKETLRLFSRRVHTDMSFAGLEQVDSGLGVQCLDDNGDISVFEAYASSLDNRSSRSEYRSQKILEVCLWVNRYLQNPVDEQQLTTAVYVHDIFMSFLPDSILFKEDALDAVEIMLLQEHPNHAYEMLKRMPGWDGAALMVYQHHECFNGKGYPQGISGCDICTGAKIIAVADAFYNLTHPHIDKPNRGSLPRAVAEIYKSAGAQLDPLLAEAFTHAVRDYCIR